MFSGTVRENLDPLTRCSDVELWDALRKSHLAPAIDRIGGLDGLMEERGRSLSVGQRQLFCVARAVLSSAKVILCLKIFREMTTACTGNIDELRFDGKYFDFRLFALMKLQLMWI